MSTGHHNGVRLSQRQCRKYFVLLGAEMDDGRVEGGWATRDHIIFIRFLMRVSGDRPCPTEWTIGVFIPRDVARHNSGVA